MSTWVHEYKSTRVQEYKSTWVHEYMSTWVHEYMSTWVHEYMSTWVHKYISTYVHKYISTYLHTYISTWVHKYIVILIYVRYRLKWSRKSIHLYYFIYYFIQQIISTLDYIFILIILTNRLIGKRYLLQVCDCSYLALAVHLKVLFDLYLQYVLNAIMYCLTYTNNCQKH